MKLVLVKNNIVENYFNVEDSEKDEKKQLCENAGFVVVENEEALVGWVYENGVFSPPPAPVIPELPKFITKLAFRNRFTSQEKVAIEMASLDDPTASLQQRQTSATLRYYLKDVDAATYIDLDRADTQAGVQNLEAAGLIAAGRANEILTSPILPAERYRN